MPPGDEDPTDTVVRAIMSRNVSDSIVRLRVHLPPGLEMQLREAPIRDALAPAHNVAAIIREVEQDRRTRIPPSVAEGLTPMDALRLYLESRNVEPGRRGEMLRYAEGLVSSEPFSEDAS